MQMSHVANVLFGGVVSEPAKWIANQFGHVSISTIVLAWVDSGGLNCSSSDDKRIWCDAEESREEENLKDLSSSVRPRIRQILSFSWRLP
jgi:hypothetical protein